LISGGSASLGLLALFGGWGGSLRGGRGGGGGADVTVRYGTEYGSYDHRAYGNYGKELFEIHLFFQIR
jgi:hypothetical protein